MFVRSLAHSRQKLSTIAYEAACTQKRVVVGSVGERENGEGWRAVRGNNAVCAQCSLLANDDGRSVNGEARRREKDIERVVGQGGKALLVHGALPRKPLFVLHPFARSSGSARERGNEKCGGGTRGGAERETVTEIEGPKGRPTEKKDEAREKERG